MGVIAVRSEDVAGNVLGKDELSYVVAILSGPHEPKDLDVYFAPIAKQFAKLTEEGVEVSMPLRAGGERTFRHKAILGTLYADAPARAKL